MEKKIPKQHNALRDILINKYFFYQSSLSFTEKSMTFFLLACMRS